MRVFPIHVLNGFLLTLTALLLMGSAEAQVAISVEVPEQPVITVTAKNANRSADTLILYSSEFGKTTRTNPYGVEVVATPTKTSATPVKASTYEVKKVTSIWECQQSNQLTQCGNASIPEKGIVLSAAGNQREALLKALKPGTVFTLNENWFDRKTVKLSVVNPNMTNNALGCGFPGCRGGQQLIVYNQDYGKPTTQTNEYGFEVTVQNGVVVAHEGSDSVIPQNFDPVNTPQLEFNQRNFVLSGHGTARNWLIANAPIGAKMMLKEDGSELIAVIDFDTYKFQLDQRLAESRCLKAAPADPKCGAPFRKFKTDIAAKRQEADRLYAAGQEAEAVKLLMTTLEETNQRLWSEFPAFPADSLKGIWHRPVEKNAAEIGRTLDSLKKAGLNTVFLETVFHGYTIFPSETLKAYGLPMQNPQFQGLDHLKTWLDLAHQRQMKVHVWIHTFYVGTKANQPPGPVLSKYPQWANVQYSALMTPPTPLEKLEGKLTDAMAATLYTPPHVNETNTMIPKTDSEDPQKQPAKKLAPKAPTSSTLETGSYFLDPANPEAREFALKLVTEIADRYPVDGIQLDYIRYPSSFPKDRFSFLKTTWGYSDIARAEFQKLTGVDPTDIDFKTQPELWQQWEDYKASQVSGFVHRVHEMVVARNQRQTFAVVPAIQLSTVIFPNIDTALEQKHQDWRLWAKNHWVDFLSSITLTSAVKVVGEDTKNVLSQSGYSVPVLIGVFGPFNGNSAENLLQQIEAARESGAKSFGIFDTAHLTGRMINALSVSQGGQPENR